MHSGSNSYIDKCGKAAMLCYACMGVVLCICLGLYIYSLLFN